MREILIIGALCFLNASSVSAQTYEEIETSHQEAIEMTVVTETAVAYERPSSSAEVATQLNRGDAVLAYEMFAGWYAVAQPGHGHIGYVQRARLDQYSEAQERPGEASQSIRNPWTHHKKIARYGLAGTGAATFIGSLAMGDEYFATTVIPVIGPFVTMARIENDPGAYYLPGGRPLLMASGIAQSAFLIYYVTAWTGEANHEVRGFSVSPSLGSMGVSVRYQF